MKKPKEMKKGTNIYVKTKYGSYIPKNYDGMAAQKNAVSYKELVKLGYT